MIVAIEYEIGFGVRKESVQVVRTWLPDDGREIIPRRCECVIKERNSNTVEYAFNQVRPLSYCIAKCRFNGGVYPILMFQLTVAHPRWRWFWKSVRKPGIMVSADKFHAGRAQH